MKPIVRRTGPTRAPALAAVLVAAALTACAPGSRSSAAPSSGAGGAAALPSTYVYQCEGGYRFVAMVASDGVALRLGDRVARLPHVVSASGARYSDGRTTFWSKGMEALLETPTASYSSCVGQHAESPEAAARILANGGGAPLTDVQWTLWKLDDAPALPDPGGRLPFLRFTQVDARVVGASGCNSLSGRYSLQGDRLRIREGLAMTRRACVDPALARQEQEFVDALQRIDRYATWGDILTLYAGEEIVARLTSGGG